MCDKNDPLEDLMGLLSNMPKKYVTMMNLPRYAQAIQSIKRIVEYVKKDCPDADAKVYFDELTNMTLCLKIIADEFNVYDIEAFSKAISLASTMCVIPRTDAKLEIGFTYGDTKIRIPVEDQ